MFDTGAGVEVVENEGFLSTRIYLPWTYLVRGVVSREKLRIEFVKNLFNNLVSRSRIKLKGCWAIGISTSRTI